MNMPLRAMAAFEDGDPATATTKTLEKNEDRQATVTRSYLAERVHQALGVSKAQASIFVEQVFDEIFSVIVSGEGVKLSGFGAFDVREKGERDGRNPKTGAKAKISARRVVVFRASHGLRARVEAGPKINLGDHEDKS